MSPLTNNLLPISSILTFTSLVSSVHITRKTRLQCSTLKGQSFSTLFCPQVKASVLLLSIRYPNLKNKGLNEQRANRQVSNAQHCSYTRLQCPPELVRQRFSAPAATELITRASTTHKGRFQCPYYPEVKSPVPIPLERKPQRPGYCTSLLTQAHPWYSAPAKHVQHTKQGKCPPSRYRGSPGRSGNPADGVGECWGWQQGGNGGIGGKMEETSLNIDVFMTPGKRFI